MDLELLTRKTIEIVRQASSFIQQEAALFSRDKIEYKDLNNLVSYVDKEAEKLLVAGLSNLLPEASYITEEGTTGIEPDPTALNWIIDPLDGTTNFIHGIPVYCVSVGLARGKELLLGVIHEPNLNEMFYAWQGGGAWCNDKPIKVSTVPSLQDSLIATGFPYYKFEKQKRYMHILELLMQRTHGIRRMGAAAVDLAYVAAGRFDGFYEYNLNSWDMAAGVLMIKEAGGKVTDFQGTDNYLFGGDIIATAGPAHQQLVEVIRENF
ncbi:inositol monophosphatase family protein [Dyadobacter sp. Leaf189]|uniref:inositol monophosphatase family protein n=1 Tax=Dyadobacter sp. Leaf189 TaxID=1736295 RepID=UPI0006F290E5|nr:inositol monophosphatase family protein [Dyadobacter sp. Leaf189]KQS33626.1 inositol monophosphatase [Dyadobacter sp. Leaf189]